MKGQIRDPSATQSWERRSRLKRLIYLALTIIVISALFAFVFYDTKPQDQPVDGQSSLSVPA